MLSVGDRVLNYGFNSIWLNGKCPCLILPEPSPKVVPLDLINQIPSLLRDGVHTKWTRPKIEYETGVAIRHGRIICETSFAVPTKDAMPSVDHESIESGDDGEAEGDKVDEDKEDTEDVSTDAYYDSDLHTSEDSDWDKPVWRHFRKHDSRFGARDLAQVAKS